MDRRCELIPRGGHGRKILPRPRCCWRQRRHGGTICYVYSTWRPALLAWFFVTAPAAAAVAQGSPEQIAQGDSLLRLLHPEQALAHYHAALRADSTNHQALWKTARATIDIAKQITADDGPERKRRDSLYLLAKGYAERP